MLSHSVRTENVAAKAEKLQPSVSHAAILLMMATLFVVLLLTLSFFADSGMVNNSQAVLLTFCLNGVLAAVMLVVEIARRPFSLAQIHWIFYLCFFALAPLSQYMYGYWCWDFILSDETLLTVNVLLTMWGGVFAFATLVGRGRGRREKLSALLDGIPTVTPGAAMLVTTLAVIATLLLVSLVGFDNLFARSTYSLGLDKTMTLLVDKILRATPVFAFVFVWVRHQQSGRCGALLCICAACLLVADFPAGMPRYNAAAIYGGLALLICPPLRKKKGLFPFLFLLLFLVVFPASNVFRGNTFSLALLIETTASVVSNLPRGFCAADYDAYSMFARTLLYVRDVGSSMGFQLVTALLFFVPRAWWAGKGLGSGETVAIAQSQSYTNLSCPLPAEGLMNYGLVGILVFSAIFGTVCVRCDRWFHESAGGGRLFYPFLCMFWFFMLRGDLLSSTAYLVGYATVFALMLWIVACFGRCSDSIGLSSHGVLSRVTSGFRFRH